MTLPSESTQTNTRLRHQKYYITDELITFAIEDQLFRVHRYFFEWESDFFKSMFTLPSGDKMVEGTSDETALFLPGVTVRQFESLLDFLYFRQSIEDTFLSQENWIDLLGITTRYSCENIRKRAIQELSRSATIDPVKIIVLAIRYDVPQWLKEAYMLLCIRSKPLVESEAEQLGMAITVKIGQAREKYREGGRGSDPCTPEFTPTPQSNTPVEQKLEYDWARDSRMPVKAEDIIGQIFGV